VSGESGNRIRSGLFEINLSSGQLLKQGRKLHLQDQPFRVLRVLLERPGELVTREELQKRLWSSGTHVGFDEGINTAIRRLRFVFSDSADNPRFIETIPRCGYRFIAPVHTVEAERSEAQPSQSTTRLSAPEVEISVAPAEPRRIWHVGILLSLLLAAALLGIALASSSDLKGWFQSHWIPAKPIRSLAVLPLENLSDNAADNYFADGMTDELITEIGQINALRVISRTSIMQYKGARKSLPQIAQELNVDAVLEGTVLKSGQDVRITVQLIQAQTDKHLWARSYRGDLRDVLQFQNQVANAVAEEVRVKLSPGETASLKARTTADPEAHEDYLKGLYFWNKRDGDGLNKAVAYYRQAIARDPNYALPYAGLAQSYVLLAGLHASPESLLSQAQSAAEKALSLNPDLAEAHTALALIYGHGWDFVAEEREFKLAVALGPNYPTAHHWYGEGYLAQIGRFDQADEEMQLALALDPVSRIIVTDWGATLAMERRYDASYRQLSKAIEMDPGFSEAYALRGIVLLQLGRHSEALKDLETARRIDGEDTDGHLGFLAYAYGIAGEEASAREILEKLLKLSHTTYVRPWSISLAYLGLGQKNEFFVWIEKAFQERSPNLPCARIWFLYDSVRTDPRFKDLLTRMNLPE
jgi:TolB-like protein/DNA-binding winged helix-turn-helix (wHTH) protein/Tfp pilus assembly protein PilF